LLSVWEVAKVVHVFFLVDVVDDSDGRAMKQEEVAACQEKVTVNESLRLGSVSHTNMVRSDVPHYFWCGKQVVRLVLLVISYRNLDHHVLPGLPVLEVEVLIEPIHHQLLLQVRLVVLYVQVF